MSNATNAAKVDTRSIGAVPGYSKYLNRFAAGASVTLLASFLLTVFLAPLGYMVATSLKSRDQIFSGEILPMSPASFTYEGPPIEDYKIETGDVMDIYEVPIDGNIQELALAAPRRQESFFMDPNDPDRGLIQWEGVWRQLKPANELDLHFENYETAWEGIEFPKLLRNTLIIAVFGVIGTNISCVMVAYAFARFPLPFKEAIFLVLLSTIILPRQVTLVPTYVFFSEIGWTGTWLPLIVPHFFANAYNVFLLRQFFRTLPRELDEAAMIDGAGPLKILWYVIVPQSWPAIVAISLFHFVFAWNDYFEPLIYLLGKPDLVPISVGIQQFNFIYDQQIHLVQSTALMALVIPVLLFFFSQRVFMRGIVVTGVDK